MSEIKIKIDSSDIDVAIAKVSHLIELVKCLPSGLLSAESSCKVDSANRGSLCKEAFSVATDPDGGGKVFINDVFIKRLETDYLGVNADSIIKNAIDNNKEVENLKNGEHCGGYVVTHPVYGAVMRMSKIIGGIKKPQKNDTSTCDTLDIYHCVRDALHRFEVKLDGMKYEAAPGIKNDICAGEGAISKAIHNG